MELNLKKRLSDYLSEAKNKFKDGSKERGKEIAIDLPIDQIIMFIVTYLIGSLSVATAIFTIVGPVLNCNPPRDLNHGAKAAYAESFCWQSSSTVNGKCHKHELNLNGTRLLDSHEEIKDLYKWFPYILFAQIFFFFQLWAYWHYKFGSRLTGQLIYMKQTLEELFKSLEEIDNVESNENQNAKNTEQKKKQIKPFDEESNIFNINEVYGNCTDIKIYHSPFDRNEDSTGKIQKKVLESVVLSICENAQFEKITPLSCEKLTGQMRDRHLFSIFCYQNFASLKCFIHILSTIRLYNLYSTGKEPQINKEYLLKNCILMQWCHPRNFSNNILTKAYFLRQILNAVCAFVFLIIMTFWYLFQLKKSEDTAAKMFRCFLTYEEAKNQLVFCWIHRKREVFMFYWIDYVLLFLIFFLSLYQWRSTRNKTNLTVCYFFENIVEVWKILEEQRIKLKKDNKNKQKESDESEEKKLEQNVAPYFYVSGKEWEEASAILDEFVKDVFKREKYN